jgi:SAM-dependent methyltransferase
LRLESFASSFHFMRREINDSITRGQFAGHETFPLRLLWLKKAYEAVKDGAPAGTFHEQNAIARFGVGRNMAQAMHYWALASGFIENDGRVLRPTRLGHAVLAGVGHDPYVERPATVWLAHWHIASTAKLTTTAYYAFNALSTIEFDPSTLVSELHALAQDRGWRASSTTLKRDVEVLLRSYVRRHDANLEDAAEPLLAELGLIREARIGGWYEFIRGPKPSLHDGVFAYALNDFWNGIANGSTALTAEQICYAPGSPGRVFKMDEDSIVTRLMGMERLTAGAWVWTDTAGLRQIQRKDKVDDLAMLSQAYPERKVTAPEDDDAMEAA